MNIDFYTDLVWNKINNEANKKVLFNKIFLKPFEIAFKTWKT